MDRTGHPFANPRLLILLVTMLCAAVATLVYGAARHTSSAAPAPKAQGAWLITGVNTPRLLKLLGLDASTKGRLNGHSVVYMRMPGQTDWPVSVAVGVHRTVAEAKQSFQAMSATQIAPTYVPNSRAGDERYFWRGDPGPKGDYALRHGYNGWPGRCFVRRRNVAVGFNFRGPLATGIALAAKLDHELVSSEELAPKGSAVPIPRMAFDAPKTVPLAHQSVPVELYSVDGARIFGLSTKDSETSAARGWHYYRADRLGTKQLSWQLASESNVIFSTSAAFEVVSPQQYEATRAVHPWHWPSKAIYFRSDPRSKEHVDLPYHIDDGEWLKPDPGSIGTYDSGDEDKKKRLVTQALQEWKRALKPEWLPAFDMVTVAYEGTRSEPTAYVAYSTFIHNGCNVLIMAKLGKSFLVYVEQPATLPSDVTPIEAADFVRPEHFAAVAATSEQPTSAPVRHKFKSSSLFRYRAFNPAGPYSRVRIVLARFNAAEDADLTFPGYEGEGYR